MAQIFNSLGSLTTLKSILAENKIHEFKSLKEVIEFQKSFLKNRNHIILKHERIIEDEKTSLILELNELELSIEKLKIETETLLIDKINSLKTKLNLMISSEPKNIIFNSLYNAKKWYLEKKISNQEKSFNLNVQKSISKLVERKKIKTNRNEFICNSFNEAVRQSAENEILELERKISVIDNLNPYIYGALGEQKVVKIIESLPNEYYLINDFDISFDKAIFYKKEEEYIKSIQIDHILISPSGIFLIETKNWSNKSLQNIDLRSPIDQIRRSSFALFILLNSETAKYSLNQHHWGEKKMSIKNLLVFINNKPKEEFQYVKIVTLNELINYITYFKPIYSATETKRISEYLIGINKKNI